MRALCWAGNRLEKKDGIIAFITGNGWLEHAGFSGMRYHLARQFSKICVINLRGDIRKSQLSGSQGEGENIFGNKSQNGIAITFLIRNASKSSEREEGEILYYDIGKNLPRKVKIAKLEVFRSVSGIARAEKFRIIKPDIYADWLSHRTPEFGLYAPMHEPKTPSIPALFSERFPGQATNRDAWVINPSREVLEKNVRSMIAVFNDNRQKIPVEKIKAFSQQRRTRQTYQGRDQTKTLKKISWSRQTPRAFTERRGPI